MPERVVISFGRNVGNLIEGDGLVLVGARFRKRIVPSLGSNVGDLVHRPLLASNLIDSNIVLLVEFVILVESHLAVILQDIRAHLVQGASHCLSNLLKIILVVLVQLTKKAVHDVFALGLRHIDRLFLDDLSRFLLDRRHGTHRLHELINTMVILKDKNQ